MTEKMKNSILLCAALGVVMAGCNPTDPTADLCKGRKAGDLVITEIMIDPDAGILG